MIKSFINERIWPRTNRSGDCWEWLGAKTKAGYGLIKFGPRWSPVLYVHRLVFEAFNGSIPDGAYICHRCDNPRCCRPEHLFLGNASINNRDASAKGRSRGPNLRGAANPAAKLSEGEVDEIRMLLSQGSRGADLARRYGVTTTTISSIKYRKTWK